MASEVDVKENKIESETFKPTGRRLGLGCWGVVDEYVDPAGQKWAIKIFNPNDIARRQMQERKWTEEDVMRREAIPLDAAYHNLVPRIIERDKNGTLYAGMPVFSEGTLDERLKFYSQNGNLPEVLGVGRDIADALSCLHSMPENAGNFYGIYERRVHGDVKPSNILLKDRKAFLTDFGSSTCISLSGTGDVRGKHGDINYRAPECFKEDAKPSVRADVWSLGAVLYKAVTGEGIYDGNPGFVGLNEEETERLIRKRLKKVPRKARKFLGKCLAYSEWNRFSGGSAALSELEKLIGNLDGWKAFKNHAKKWILPLAIPTAMIVLGTYAYSTYEPEKLEMPTTHRIEGVLYPPENEDTSSLEFVAENIVDLPEAPLPMGIAVPGIERGSKNSTENRVVAYLVKTHMQAAVRQTLPEYSANDYQYKTYLAYTPLDEMRTTLPGRDYNCVAKSIEVALNHARIEGDKVDLEDVLAISRVGVELVDQAKRVSGSFDWEKYREAKDSRGEYIIPKKERKFIDQWISYFHKDVD
jgi:serine/threonine protein kinase